MLTKQEQEWLENRKSQKQTTCENCGWYKFRSRVSWMEYWNGCHDSRGDGRCTGIDVLREAAEFEARVSMYLSERIHDAYSEGYYDHENVGRWERFDSEPWDELKRARLKIEEEMDNADRAGKEMAQ